MLFEPGQVEQAIGTGPPPTKLTAFFNMNKEDINARTIIFSDFPQYFTWNQKEHKWQRRKRGARNPDVTDEFRADTIGRIPTVSLRPHQAELYHLRMLLHHKPGATSFTDLKTIQGATYDSFQECCYKLGLLDNDAEKDATMEEATAIRFGPQLRLAFATILIYCRPADPLPFWEKHKLELCRDFMMRDKIGDLTHYVEYETLSHWQEFLDNEGLDLNRDFKNHKLRYLHQLTDCPNQCMMSCSTTVKF